MNGERTGEMLENGLFIDLDRLRLADLRAFTHLPVTIAESEQRRSRSISYCKQSLEILDSLSSSIREERVHDEHSSERRTDIVNSASPVPISPPFPRPANRMSAKTSGKLRKHDARMECKPSFSSFSLRSARRDMTSLHRACNEVSEE